MLKNKINQPKNKTKTKPPALLSRTFVRTFNTFEFESHAYKIIIVTL